MTHHKLDKWLDDPNTWGWTDSKPSSKTDINNVLMHLGTAEGLLRFCVKCKGDRGAVEFYSPARDKPFSITSGCSGKKRQEFREFLRFPAHRRALDEMLKQRRRFSG